MYLENLLPKEGLYCVAMLLPSGSFRHWFYKTIPEAQEKIDELDRTGQNVYIAQAAFDELTVRDAQQHNAPLPRTLTKEERKQQRKKERSQDNATALRNFFIDIDCGEKWPLKNQLEGAQALQEFIQLTGLPNPSVVNSGNGLYAQWLLIDAVPAQQWRTVAGILKQVIAKFKPELGADSTRTSDSASVLRPPGTTNRKPGKDPKPVVLLREEPAVDFLEFVKLLGTAARKRGGNRSVDTTVLQPPKPGKDVNAEFFSGLEYQSQPSDAEQVAERCAQLRLMRDTKGDITEPLWYACLGLLLFCQDGEEIAHRWSAGHSDYSSSQTEEKIGQWRLAGVGPTVCSNLGAVNPSGCIGCPHNGKIKSPIVLGRPDPKPVEMPEEDVDTVPEGFRRGEGGLFASEDDRWVKFYDQDLWVDRLAWDESLGYEVMTVKHSLPYEGELECTLRSSTVNDPKALMTVLSDNHIKVVGAKEKKIMAAYLESYAARLQRKRQMTMLFCQMGWKKSRSGQDMFVLGRQLLHADGRQEAASLARNVPEAARGFRSQGELANWTAATKPLGAPGMEPFAFSLLCGFAAPLMVYTGYDGALVSLVGDSGAGKTLMLSFALSIWGKDSELIMLRGDTDNSLVARLGVYGNLPMAIDEVTNIDHKSLSDLAYRITQGRDKARLTRTAEEKRNINGWNTLAITSSNSSLVDKLAHLKHDPSAEFNRIFEYRVNKHHRFEGDVTKNIYWTLQDNYGLAGVKYASWLVQNSKRLRDDLDAVRARIDAAACVRPDERFWSAVVSTAIYGGLIASKLGLIEFPIAPVMDWATETLYNMRGDKVELTTDAVAILGQFIDENAANRLIVQGLGRIPNGMVVVETPRGALLIRVEWDSKRMYISRNAFKSWLAKKSGSYSDIMSRLKALDIVVNPNKRKVLGAGTNLAGAQVPCIEINMNNKRLGDQLIDLSEQVREELKN